MKNFFSSLEFKKTLKSKIFFLQKGGRKEKNIYYFEGRNAIKINDRGEREVKPLSVPLMLKFL